MTVRNLSYLFQPKSVAVIGASAKAGGVGHIVLQNIIGAAFDGPVYPVNPHYQELAGLACYTDIAALPAAPDLAIIATPPDAVAQVIADLGSRGTRAAVVITAGFGEGGHAEGERRRLAVLNAAKPYLLRVVGPNCFGLILPHVGLNASFARVTPDKGGVAFVTQSGAVMAAMMDWALPRNIGFSAAVSVGDMTEVDFGDLLDYLSSDPTTHSILLYVEAITHPRKFMSAARAAARNKPVIVIKGGRHAAAAKAAASHTGALAGSDAVYDAVFSRAGLLRVHTMQQLFDTAELLATAPAVHGDRLGIITNGGGVGVLATDDLLDGGGHLADLSSTTIARLNAILPVAWSHGNPVDIIGDAKSDRYIAALDAMVNDPGVDAVLLMHCPTAVADPLQTAIDIIAAKASDKPLLTAWLGDASVETARDYFTNHKIPAFASGEEAISGFLNLVRYRRRREALMEAPQLSTSVAFANVEEVQTIIAGTPSNTPSWLAPQEAKRLLTLYGIPTNLGTLAATPSGAGQAADKMAGPVALKIVSRDIVHKSDVGGVVLNLQGQQAVATAAMHMSEAVQRSLPNARIDGFLIEPMIQCPHAQELFLGVTNDPTFGPVIAFGHGGTAIEVIDDKTIGFPPLNLTLARAMIRDTRIGRLLAGYRDRPPADLDAIATALVALSELVVNHPEIVDLDVNPLLADENGIIALDARVRVDHGTPPDRLIICPYPAALEQTHQLGFDERVFIRPIRPDDEKRVQAMIARLAPDDAHMRFFAAVKSLDRATVARLTQIDYDREMALLAFAADGSDDVPWGIGRIHADPDNSRAEFAVAVRSDRQDKGLATLLIARLLEIAAGRGIDEVWGDVLTGNKRMLTLCEELGFTVNRSAASPEILEVCHTLAANKTANF